jgi:hypothetical protein
MGRHACLCITHGCHQCTCGGRVELDPCHRLIDYLVFIYFHLILHQFGSLNAIQNKVRDIVNGLKSTEKKKSHGILFQVELMGLNCHSVCSWKVWSNLLHLYTLSLAQGWPRRIKWTLNTIFKLNLNCQSKHFKGSRASGKKLQTSPVHLCQPWFQETSIPRRNKDLSKRLM